VSTVYVNGTQLGNITYFENLPKISVVQAAVSNNQCREVTPMAKIYKPAAAYDAEHPHFRTDCNSPSPRDWPLDPGRTGRPLSYLDKQTDTLLYLGKRKGHFVEIHFDSSQFGVVDIKNGNFLFAGQN
jgi:hypothetical protein